MTRLLALALTFSVALLAGCSSSSARETQPSRDSGQHDDGAIEAGATDADADSRIGTPCVRDDESNAAFQGFSVFGVSIAEGVSACGTGVCLLNHFQGRVTCPYGQTAPGVGPKGPSGSIAAAESSEDGCMTSGASRSPVTATNASIAGYTAGMVPPQITGTGLGDRTANKTVYCSCRCANAGGKTDDGASYCAWRS